MGRSCSALLLAVLLLVGCSQRDRPPNIVLLIGDDHGWPDSGFMGHPLVQTPVLDTLAAEGTVFTNGQNPSSLCRFSLQTLLSGLKPEQWKRKRTALRAAGTIPSRRFHRQEVEHYRTLPRELARRGYRSWQGGKMWEGSFAQAGFAAGTAGPGPFEMFMVDDFGRAGWDASKCGPTRAAGDAACPAMDPLRSFLERHREQAGDAPFFLWVAPMLPHLPFDAPPEFEAAYEGKGLTTLELLYFAQVSRLDAVIGEVLRALERGGVGENTLVIYLADNGWQVGQGLATKQGHGKGTLYELGTRTPIVFHWPGRVPSGAVRDDLIGTEDLFPTILDFAGVEPLPDRPGVSLREGIETGSPVGRDRLISFFEAAGPDEAGLYVRTPDWRYMAFGDGREELYEIRNDPFEERDVGEAQSDRLAGFRAVANEYDRDIGRPPERLEIAGRLVDDRGEPIAGATLQARPAGTAGTEAASQVGDQLAEAETNAEGGFRFAGLPRGRYRLGPGPGVEKLREDVEVTLPVGPTGSYLPRVVGVRGD